MLTFTRRSRGATSCWMALMTVSVAVLMMSIGRFTVQARSISEDDEIEAFLKRVNKPAVKSFTLEDGDVIDCVDIYKQPAFDHPLLKDHKIITAPSSFPKMDKISNASRRRIAGVATLQNGGECPEGTVPIRRTQKSDLIHAKSLAGYGRRDPGYGTREDVPVWKMVEGAGVIAFSGRDRYIGARARFNMWEVPEVEDNSWSHGSIAVSDKDQKAFIEVGWLVNPGLYGDKKTRLYAYWTADGYVSTGCYNLICPGFVQINPRYPVGTPIGPLSSYDGVQYEIRVRVNKDEEKMVWWMYVEETPVGYWPVSIFGNFVGAYQVTWTGGVLNTNNGGQHTTTDMGNGHFPEEGWAKAANINEWQVMRDYNDGYDYPSPVLYQDFASNYFCYHPKFDDNDDDHTFYYGGPGLGADRC